MLGTVHSDEAVQPAAVHAAEVVRQHDADPAADREDAARVATALKGRAVRDQGGGPGTDPGRSAGVQEAAAHASARGA